MFSGVLAPPNSRSSRLEYSMAGCENPSIFGFPLLQIVSSPISSFAFASMPLSDLHLFLYQLDLLFGCHYGFLLFCLYLLRHELQNPLRVRPTLLQSSFSTNISCNELRLFSFKDKTFHTTFFFSFYHSICNINIGQFCNISLSMIRPRL